jgi:hypothetical protein
MPDTAELARLILAQLTPGTAAVLQRLDELRELQRATWDKLCDLQDELAARPDRDPSA